MFPDSFQQQMIELNGIELCVTSGGEGPPLMLLWGTGYLGDKANSPVASWRKWAGDVSEIALDCGHFIVEEEPQQAARAMRDFFA